MYFDFLTVLFFTLAWIMLVIFLRLKKKKSPVYLLFFSIFFIYLYKVLDYTLLEFQSLLLLKAFMPDLILNGQATGEGVNLIPFATLGIHDLHTSFLNILLMIPFGFGLPFLTTFRAKKVVLTGALLSVGIELSQLVTGLIAGVTFRIADVNDVIFNTIGAAIGYMFFVVFVRACRHISQNNKLDTHPILQYITKRPQVK